MTVSFVPYPMIEEDEATGRVAAVYTRVLEHSAFVPSFLKSLALCPPYLVLAWEQWRRCSRRRASSMAQTDWRPR